MIQMLEWVVATVAARLVCGIVVRPFGQPLCVLGCSFFLAC